MPRSKKSVANNKPQNNESDFKVCCLSCGNKSQKDFYVSYNESYKNYGNKLPWCKDCIEKQYNKYFQKYNDDRLALYYTCRKFDIFYADISYKGAVVNSEKTGWTVLQSYFKQINSFKDANNYGDCFDESWNFLDNKSVLEQGNECENNEEIEENLLLFWGKGFTFEDYIFLEAELKNWQKTHKCDNQAELTLLKEICIKILEIRTAREGKEGSKAVGNLQKELQELMKTASVDPAKANVASAGKSQESYGIWIKDIEQFTPAEWYNQQEKYKDMDGFIPYINNYIVRPIRNFLTGVRDFVVNDNIDADLDSVDIEPEGDSNG